MSPTSASASPRSKASEKYLSVQLFGRPEALKYEFKIQNGLTSNVSYSFGGHSHEVAPREVITHVACNPDPIVFERAGPPLIGRRLTGTYQARDGDLFSLKSAPNGGVIIDVTSKVAPAPARASMGR